MPGVVLRVAGAYAAMCAIWGTTWLAIKVALVGLPPMTAVGVRFVLAALFVYALGRITRAPAGPRPPLRLIVVLATSMFGINYALTYFAETHLTSGLVAVLFGVMPFCIFGLGALALGERIGPRTLFGALLAFLGVALISAVEGGGLIFIVAALAAAVLSAFANVYWKRYAESDPFQTLPAAMVLSGGVLTVVGALVEQPDWSRALALDPLLATRTSRCSARGSRSISTTGCCSGSAPGSWGWTRWSSR